MKVTLEAARTNAGYNQEDVAKAIGLSKTTIINYEFGRTCPKWDTFVKLCNLYGCTTEDIIMPTQ